jgi:alanine racemase
VGYSRSFIAEKESTIAKLPVGYADGFFRALSNGKGHVFIATKKVPVVGRVCMDMIMVDVTNLHVAEGDVVELMGENISATEIGAAANTIAYEVLTHVSPRVPRVYVTE